ncbi:MAG: hypothetical protein DHS20C14_13530 [Phycisphaeraceae bacterium]|nr:MAG: hypothetical protein DHS20C14_13530 [Phycisphaeraceae bacterium]
MSERAGEVVPRRPVVSELGTWSSLYVAGLPFLAAQTLQSVGRPPWGAEVFCLLVGFGVYLLDRVGVRRADPADGAPWPGSAAARRATRVVAVLALVAASAVGWFIRPGLALGPWFGLAVVTAYSCPGRWRLKDSVWLKGPVVAACLIALGVLAADAEFVLIERPAAWITAAGLVLIVLGDCTLSDLDDREADRASGAGSVAAIAGPRAARTLALACHVLAGAALLAGPAPRLTAGIWGGAIVATTWALTAAKPARVRTMVDVRLVVIALGVWAALARLG